MAKKIKLKKQQLTAILKEDTEDDVMGHPIGGKGGSEYDPQSMDQHKRTFRAFNKTKLNEGGIQVDYDTFREEVVQFIKHLLNKPMDFKIPPFWAKLGVQAKELLDEMAQVGLISWYSPNGTVKYVAFTDNFDSKVEELYNNLSVDSESNDINEQDIETDSGPYDLIHMNEEIAIFKKDKKAFVFNYKDLSKEELEAYAETPIEPNGGHDEEGFVDYDIGDFDVDENVIEKYVNDNVHAFNIGYGLEGWSNGDNMVLITNKLKDELIRVYPQDKELETTLEGRNLQSEVTGAAGSSGSYVTKMGGDSSQQMVKRSTYYSEEYSPHSQINEQQEEETEEEMVDQGEQVEYEREMEGEESFNLNGKNFIYVWVKDETGDSKLGVYCYDDDSVQTFEKFYNDNFKDVSEATGAAGSSGAYVQPKIWAKDQKNMTHGQNPWYPSGQIIQNPMKEDQHDTTQYPGGGFVEFDDCVRYNNNKEAEKGGCSQGAKDNVVKVKKKKGGVVSKEGIYNEVARRTGRSVEEVKEIIRRKENNN